MKLKGEKTDYVISLLDADNTLTVTEAVRKMCIYFGINYKESTRE